jgi:Na+-driven multidrug efflux pump
MVVAFAFQGLGRATIPLVWMLVRTAGVLGVAVLCTHTFGLGERAVFGTIATANVVSALVMSGLFLVTERRLRRGGVATEAVGLPLTGTR